MRYNFNHQRYSQKSVFSQTERQKKSAGSTVIGIRWNYLGINSDSSIVPKLIEPKFQGFYLKTAEIYDQGIGAGYAYSLVYNNWFCNLTVMPWALYQTLNFKEVNTNKTNQLYSLQWVIQTRGAIGYHGKKDYYGLVFVTDQMRSRWKDAHDIGYNFGNVKFFYSRRINL